MYKTLLTRWTSNELGVTTGVNYKLRAAEIPIRNMMLFRYGLNPCWMWHMVGQQPCIFPCVVGSEYKNKLPACPCRLFWLLSTHQGDRLWHSQLWLKMRVHALNGCCGENSPVSEVTCLASNKHWLMLAQDVRYRTTDKVEKMNSLQSSRQCNFQRRTWHDLMLESNHPEEETHRMVSSVKQGP